MPVLPLDAAMYEGALLAHTKPLLFVVREMPLECLLVVVPGHADLLVSRSQQ
jgi:hypothetical protein